MAQRIRLEEVDRNAGPSFLSGSHHNSFQNTDLRAAGQNMYNATVNLNFVHASPSPAEQTHDDVKSSLSVGVNTPSGGSTSRGNPEVIRAPSRDSHIRNLLQRFVSRRLRIGGAAQRSRGPNVTRSMEVVEEAESGASSPTESTESCDNSCTPQDDVSVTSSLEDFDVSTSWDSLGVPEVYIRSMLNSKKGYPCWHPKPRRPFVGERGIVPGDIGTLSTIDGFEKRFNFWDDKSRWNNGNPLPLRDNVVYYEEMETGQAIVHGTSSKVYRKSDSRFPSAFEFRCQARMGAILVSTTSADLERLRDPNSLKDSLILHAEAIYRAGKGDFESLVAVTGCIKAHSWAIASYQEKAHAEAHQILRLERLSSGPADPDNIPSFVWTDQAMAEVRCGSNGGTATPGPRHKDQSLFIRGFKMTFSAKFRERMKHGSLSTDPDGSRDRASDSDGSDTGPRGGGRHSNPQGGPFSSMNSQGGNGGTKPVDGVQIKPLSGSAESLCHPCDILNRYILEQTGANCAITHDDDWRLLDFSGREDDLSWIVPEVMSASMIHVRHGVAFLEPITRGTPGSEPHIGCLSDRYQRRLSPSRVQRVSIVFLLLGLMIITLQGAALIVRPLKIAAANVDIPSLRETLSSTNVSLTILGKAAGQGKSLILHKAVFTESIPSQRTMQDLHNEMEAFKITISDFTVEEINEATDALAQTWEDISLIASGLEQLGKQRGLFDEALLRFCAEAVELSAALSSLDSDLRRRDMGPVVVEIPIRSDQLPAPGRLTIVARKADSRRHVPPPERPGYGVYIALTGPVIFLLSVASYLRLKR